MKSFAKLLQANLKQFLRDRVALFFTFAFPLLFMLIFGAVYGGSQNVNYKIALIDNDNSTLSSQISGALKQVTVFTINQEGSVDGQLEFLREGKVKAVIEIPAGSQENVSQSQPAEIKVYFDPSDTTSSSVLLSTLRQVTNQINQALTRQPPLLQVQEQSIQTRELRSIDYLVPGILAMSILFLGLFGSITLVEQREKKVLKRFGATPISRSKILSSQVVYRLILAVLQTVVIIAVAFLVFKVEVLGNWAALFGIVILGTLTFISIGYCAVSRARTVESAMPIIQLIQFPMLFLSGIFFPVEFIPSFMQPIVNAMPLTYLGDAFRQVMVQSPPLHPIGLDMIVLAGWLVVCVAVAIKFFRWE